MGLLLRPDVYYAESPYGVQLLTHEGPLTFHGGSVGMLLDRLAPYLDGRYELGELTANLSLERREQVEQLVTALRDHGAIREVGAHEPPPMVGGASRREIGYVDYFRDDGVEAFTAYCGTTTLVLGSGQLLAATARAAAHTGLRRLHTVELPAATPVNRLISGVDLVLHVSERPDEELAQSLERHCADAGTSLAQAMVCDDVAWIAPIGTSMVSGRRRHAAMRPDTEPYPDGTVEVPELAAKAVAARLLQGVFRLLTGIDDGSGDTRDTLVRTELSTLRSTTHTVARHPFVTARPPWDTEDTARSRIVALAEAPPLAPDYFSRCAAACADTTLGPIDEPDERDFVQVPLRVCAVSVSDPVGLRRPSAPAPPAVAVGAGLDFATARFRAALRSFALYGSLMVDPRRLVSSDGVPLCGPDDDPRQALARITDSDTPSHVWTRELSGGPARLVDALAVFPALAHCAYLPGQQGGAQPYQGPVGAAAGYDWHDAVETGLLEQCHQQTLAGVMSATAPFPRVDLASAWLDVAGSRYRAMVTAIGAQADIYDVTGPLGVPTVACCWAGEPVAAASGVTFSDALRNVLERALLAHQARVNDQWTYAPIPPVLSERLRGTDSRLVNDEPPVSVADMTTRLYADGLRPLVVPLDHDPEVNAAMPYVVRVVFAND